LFIKNNIIIKKLKIILFFLRDFINSIIDNIMYTYYLDNIFNPFNKNMQILRAKNNTSVSIDYGNKIEDIVLLANDTIKWSNNVIIYKYNILNKRYYNHYKGLVYIERLTINCNEDDLEIIEYIEPSNIKMACSNQCDN